MGDALATWLTVAALAQRLGRPHSTIRAWRDRYRAWVPEQRDAAGHQTYPLERVQEIAVLAAERLTPREIEAELTHRHGDTPDQTEPPADSWQAELISELRALRIAVERLADHFTPREGDV